MDNLKGSHTHLFLEYRILPNKGAGRSHKVISIHIGTKLSFWAFQRRFRIENRTIIKETTFILVIFDNIVFLQTMGAPLLWEAPLTLFHLNKKTSVNA